MSWSLFIDLGLLFVDVGLCGVTREDGGRRSESVAVLGRRERVGWVIHRVDILYDDVFVVGVLECARQSGAMSRRWRVRNGDRRSRCR